MIRASLIIIIAALLLSADIYAQTQWFNSTEGGFTINLPAKPTDESTIDSPDLKSGGKIFKWMLKDELMFFSASFADSRWAKKEEAAMRAQVSADGLIEAFEARGGGDKLISRRNITLGDIPGVEVKYGSQTITSLVRYYVGDARIYCVMGMWVPGPNESKVIKILDSFQIAPPPAAVK